MRVLTSRREAAEIVANQAEASVKNANAATKKLTDTKKRAQKRGN